MKTKIEQKFKHGDKIKCISENDGYLTKGKVYTFDSYNESIGFVKIQGTYDCGESVCNGVRADRFEPVVVEPVKPKDDRKKYTLVYSEYISCGYYRPRLKKIKVKDITKYLEKTDLDVQYVIKGHVTLV